MPLPQARFHELPLFEVEGAAWASGVLMLHPAPRSRALLGPSMAGVQPHHSVHDPVPGGLHWAAGEAWEGPPSRVNRA